jgi:hypothetical protein
MPQSFTVVFETEEALREEHRVNLAFNALSVATTEAIAPDSAVTVTLRGPFGAEMSVPAKVVASRPAGVALAIEGDPDDILNKLLERPVEEETAEAKKNTWERVRNQSQMEKILLAVKADRSDRAVLLQDNDPRVLLSVLRNPRLTVDEVVRLAKSSFLNYQIAEVIMKTAQWMASVDVRLALIHNPKTPQAFALRILPTIPEPEVRAIARGGTNMALKQAAIKRLQSRS